MRFWFVSLECLGPEFRPGPDGPILGLRARLQPVTHLFTLYGEFGRDESDDISLFPNFFGKNIPHSNPWNISSALPFIQQVCVALSPSESAARLVALTIALT